MGIPDHLTCLLRNLYAGQETTVRTGHGTTDWFQIRKGVRQGCILSPCLFNLYAEYITRNAGLEEAQAGIKIAGRNINNLTLLRTSYFSHPVAQRDFPGGSVVKSLPAVLEMWEMQVQSLGLKDPLEKGLATHSSILAGELHGQKSLVGYSP